MICWNWKVLQVVLLLLKMSSHQLQERKLLVESKTLKICNSITTELFVQEMFYLERKGNVQTCLNNMIEKLIK